MPAAETRTEPGPACPQDRPGARARPTPTPRCELDFANPFELLVVTVLSAQTTDQPGQRGASRRCSPPTPTRPRWPPPTARHLETHHRPARLLPGQDRVAAQAQRRARRAVRRRGARPPRRPGHAARCRPQDRQRRARQRLRRAGHHRRHPLRAPRAPVRLDRRDRPGQGRARGRRAVPQARLDDAQPPRHLARAPSLPREEAGLRRLPGRAAGARRTARGRPTRRSPPSWSRPKAPREAAPRGRSRWRLALTGCSDDVSPPGNERQVDVDTPELRELKADAGIEPCEPGAGDQRPARPHPAAAWAVAAMSTSRPSRTAADQHLELAVPALPQGDAGAPGVPREVRRAGRRARHRRRRHLPRGRDRPRRRDAGPPTPSSPTPTARSTTRTMSPSGPACPSSSCSTQRDRSPVRPPAGSTRSTRSSPSWRTTSGSPCEREMTFEEHPGLPDWLRPVETGSPLDHGARPDPVHGARRRRGRPPLGGADALRRGPRRSRPAAHRARPPHALPPRAGVVPGRLDRPR